MSYERGYSSFPPLPMAPAAAGPALRWRRLHPLTPVVGAGRGLILMGIYAVEGRLNSGSSGELVPLIIIGALTLATMGFGLVRWLVTRWALDGPVLRIETGLLRRDHRQLPLARIQAVDVVRPYLARLCGLAELRVRVPGTSRANGRLAYISEPEAVELRARLLAGHHGLDQSTPEPVEMPVASVGTAQLVTSVFLSLPALVAVAILASLGVALALGGTTAAEGAAGFVGAYLLGLGGAIWRRIVELYGFSIGVAPDGIRIKRGLFSTVAETVPVSRVQAVRLVQPLAWRPFGWCRLEVDVAGSPGQEQGTRSSRATKALLPVGQRAMADQIFVSLLGLHQFQLTPSPRRARWKAPLRYHFMAGGCDGRVVAASTGRFRKVTTWAPLEKLQSVRQLQGPVQRRLGLASVYVDVAGRRVRVELRDRDAAEATSLVGNLAELSRQARKNLSGPQGLNSPRAAEVGMGQPLPPGPRA